MAFSFPHNLSQNIKSLKSQHFSPQKVIPQSEILLQSQVTKQKPKVILASVQESFFHFSHQILWTQNILNHILQQFQHNI